MSKIDHLKAIAELLEDRHFSYNQKKVQDQIKLQLHRIVITLQNQTGQNYIFKYLLIDTPKTRALFKREIDVLKKIESISESLFSANKVIEDGEKPMPWIIMTYVKGNITGNTFEFNENILDNQFIEFLGKAIPYIALLSQTKANQTIINSNKLSLEKLMARASNHTILSLYSNKISQLYQKNIDFISDPKYYCWAHGDFSPLNILKNGENYSVIDWESFDHNLVVFEPAYIYERMWKTPDKQELFYKKIFSQYLNSNLKFLFDFQILIMLLIDIFTFDLMLEQRRPKIFHNQFDFTKIELEEKRKLYLEKYVKILKEGIEY